MPFSSSSLTREASVKRGGGCVKCCSGRSFRSRSTIPVSSGGSIRSSDFSRGSPFSCFSGSAPASSSGGFAP